MSELACVYIIEIEGSDKYYIGSTGNIKQREHSHRHQLKHGNHSNAGLQELWNAGAKFTFNIVDMGSREKMYRVEQRLISSSRDDVKMLNVGLSIKGGDNLTRNPKRLEIIQRITLSILKRYREQTQEERAKHSARVKGVLNPMYGKRHSAEVRKRQSELMIGHSYNKGRKLSEQHVRQMSERGKLLVGEKNPFFGKKHSEETRRILSEKNTGQAPTRWNSIEIDGIPYKTQTEAAKALGVSNPTITYRLKSKNPLYSGYIVIESSRE